MRPGGINFIMTHAATDLIDAHLNPRDLGPAMLACTERQRRFVICMLEMPNVDHTKAARAAGFADKDDSGIRATAWRLAHSERVQAAIQEEARKRINSMAIVAASRLGEMLENPGHKDHYKAVTAVLNRTGLHEKTESVSTVRHEVADEAAIEKIERLARALNLDASALLGRAGVKRPKVIDITPESSGREGLEDLL